MDSQQYQFALAANILVKLYKIHCRATKIIIPPLEPRLRPPTYVNVNNIYTEKERQMSTALAPVSWARQAEHWLDAYGKPAWIAAMVLAFIVFWPIGLALLAYMIWGKKMFGKSYRNSLQRGAMAAQSSGNSAFDAYAPSVTH